MPKVIHSIEKTSSGAIHHLTWESKPMNNMAYIHLSKYIKLSRDYGPLNLKKTKDLTIAVNNVNDRYKCDVTLDQAISLRNIVLKDKIIKNYSRMNQRIDRIYTEYEHGIDILELSYNYDFPPLNLLRGVFLRKGYNASSIYDIFTNKKNPKSLLSGRDLKQFKLAESNDAESTFNQQRVAEIAAINEEKFINYFKSIGIKLRTQEQLVREQIAQYGRPVLTPDVLFTDEVYINGKRVHWIDYKDYLGTDVRFLFTSNMNQSVKYAEKWGPGALCYRKSFVSGLYIPGAMLLDARVLNLKMIE